MKRLTQGLALFFSVLTFWISGPAAAGLTALISIHEGSADMWEQRETLHQLLRQRFGFDDVRFLVDATPDEIPGHLQQFLEETAQPGDRRLVWISGLDRHQEDSICADVTFGSVHPAAPSLILAPACYADIIALPQGSRHYALTVPETAAITARLGRTRATEAPWIALLSLPSRGEEMIRGANSLILEHLQAAPGTHLDPAALLRLLRTRFRWNGSNFTPALDLFDRGLSPADLLPFGVRGISGQQEAPVAGTPVPLRRASFGLYATPDAEDGLAMHVRADAPVRVLRRDRDGLMRYVAVGSGFYGWVKTDDLAE